MERTKYEKTSPNDILSSVIMMAIVEDFQANMKLKRVHFFVQHLMQFLAYMRNHQAKLNKFWFLCHSNTITQTYHLCYKNLQYDEQGKDRLAQPHAIGNDKLDLHVE